MERIEVLISKLNEQFKQKASPEQLLFTVQLLQNELVANQQNKKSFGTSKVSVLMPTVMNVDSSQYEKYAPRPAEPSTPVAAELKEKVLVENESVSIVQENGQLDMVFDPLVEIPTLSHQIKSKQDGQPSINDRLKQGKAELVEVLKETPIKDLRKAIGINDRFVFINDLFRGDEVMYERSIKTINSFNIYPEAEYWISRELKIKLGWDNELPIVAQFDHLVKRRFS